MALEAAPVPAGAAAIAGADAIGVGANGVDVVAGAAAGGETIMVTGFGVSADGPS